MTLRLNTTSRQRGVGALLASALLALSAPACSVLFDIAADQCTTSADCAGFDGYPVCSDGVCVANRASTGGTGGTGSTGGKSDAGAPSMPPAGDGGEAGAPFVAECATNGECIDANFGQPFICQQGRCVGLVTPECPQVIGPDNLRAKQPIIFGAYTLAPDAVSRSVAARNIDLAVSEFTNKVTGLRGGPGGSKRTLSFVVCNSSYPGAAPGTIDAFEPSLGHLVDTLHVPGILSALSTRDLEAVFGQRLDQAGTFVISPFEQDSELQTLANGGRLWTLLGPTADLAPTFAPLLKRTEKYLRAAKDADFLNLGKDGKLRVALVTADVARETDVRDALLDLPELADFDVQSFSIQSALTTAKPDLSAAIADIISFAPNIIVGLAGSEFSENVFPALENGSTWSTSTQDQKRPMYLIGPAMGAETWALYQPRIGEGTGGWKNLFQRLLGVAYASEDQPLLKDYQTRIMAASSDLKDPTVVLGSENVYDASYLMIYAAAAAGSVADLSGADLARGMKRLVAPDGGAYDIGPAAISRVLTELDNGGNLLLGLTMGAPNWKLALGTRPAVGSVYCFNTVAAPGGPVNDALRLKTDGTLEDKSIPCIVGF